MRHLTKRRGLGLLGVAAALAVVAAILLRFLGACRE